MHRGSSSSEGGNLFGRKVVVVEVCQHGASVCELNLYGFGCIDCVEFDTCQRSVGFCHEGYLSIGVLVGVVCIILPSHHVHDR